MEGTGNVMKSLVEKLEGKRTLGKSRWVDNGYENCDKYSDLIKKKTSEC
jgi:hypothetical protein